MPYDDMTRCPQSEDEFREYFYTLIQRSLGAPANDFEAVLSATYSWQGQQLMIPVGVGPGIKQQPGAPFFGLTQQFSGVPKARVFLPADDADENGYYTRAMQYVDDAVGTYAHTKTAPTPQNAGLIWSWYYIAGNPYVPIQRPDAGGGTVPPPTGGLTEAQVQAMIDAAVAPLASQIAVLSQPMRAHGPVNLPIVFESLTSLRCKGDIDVQVKPGQATPPPDTSSEPSDLATVVMLKKLVARRNEPDEGS